MAQRRNYGFERRRREEALRAKQQAKRERRTERGGSGAGPDIGPAQETGAPAGMWEWFSASRSRVMTTPTGQRPAADSPDDWVLLTDVSTEGGDPSGEGEGKQ